MIRYVAPSNAAPANRGSGGAVTRRLGGSPREVGFTTAHHDKPKRIQPLRRAPSPAPSNF